MLKKAVEMKQVDKEGDLYLQKENVPEKGSISGPWTQVDPTPESENENS